MFIKNIGIMAHVDAGKTTVTEQILYKTGIINTPGRVDTGSTVTDSLNVERQRGITVKSGSVSIIHHNCKINILDTPGHMDFYSEVQRVFGVLEGAVLVISAKEGIQSQTRNIFRKLEEMKIPALIFINKIDRCTDNNELEELYKAIKNLLTGDILIMENVFNNEIIQKDICCDEILDCLIERDEILQNKFLNDIPIYKDDVYNGLKKSVAKCRVYPVYHGSALKGEGIETLIDGLDLLPYYRGNEEDDFSGYVFKVERDEKLNRYSYIKVMSGKLKQRQLICLEAEKEYKIKGLQKIDGTKKSNCDSVACGDIALLPFAKEFKIGDIIGERNTEIAPYSPGNSVLQIITNCKKEDKMRLCEALSHLTEEDPDLSLRISEKGEISISVMGNTQIEIIENILLERYKLEVSFGERETVFRERPKKQSSSIIYFGIAPNPYWATVGLTIEPLPLNSGIVYESKISYGYLNLSFQNGVKDGVMEFVKSGLYGWAITDCKITFYEAFYSSPVSTPADFRNLTPYVLEKAFEEGEMEILEPIYSYVLEIPEDCIGKAVYDIYSMRGSTEEIITKGTMAEIKGKIPVDTCKEYSVEVSSYTKGEGIFNYNFFGYDFYKGEKICSKFMKDRSSDKLRNMFIKARK